MDGLEATGWGLGWYSSSGASAVVVKDPVANGSDTVLNRVLRDWERLRSSIFLCHIRVANAGVEQEDTHPFQRSYGGRDWLFAHDGYLDLRQLLEFQLGDPPQFEPVGRTDSNSTAKKKLRRRRASGISSPAEPEKCPKSEAPSVVLSFQW